MEMTLHNFEKYIDATILERGCDYFENGYVDELEEIESGLWMAQVYGTENYTIGVRLGGNRINAWECNCPYDYGPICKHVVAVFYAINEALTIKKTEIKKKQKRGKAKKKSRVEIIFQKVTKEDLRSFIVDQFGTDYRFRNAFIAYFAELLDEDDDQKYRSIIRNISRAAADRHGFIDYRAAHGLTNQLYQLIDKAERLLDDNNLTESLSICKTLIEEIPGILQNMDDSDGGAGDIVYSSFEVLHEIVSIAPPLLKDELFNYALGEYQKEKYADFGFEDFFLNLFPALVTTEEQERIFFGIIDTRIKSEKKKDYPEYGVTRLLITKVDYLQANNRKEEAWKIMMDNIMYSSFREMIVNEYIGQKNYAEAKKLVYEAIALEEKNSRYSIVSNWQKKLLEIAEIENDVEEIRNWSEKLFFKNRFGMEYYRKMKKTYSVKEWKKKSEEIINIIKGKSQVGGYSDANALADIFVEENLKEGLLKLLQINVKHLEFVDMYAEHLVDDFRNEIGDIYEEGIKNYAENTGRNVYNQVTVFLKKLLTIDGQPDRVEKIIGGFREKYKNRRAMMEILNKNFPSTVPDPKNIQKFIDRQLGLL